MKNRTYLVGLVGFFYSLTLLAASEASEIQLALNWKAEPQFGGFYAAQMNGDFSQSGLKVRILEGGSGTPTVQMLAAGKVDYAIVSADEIILAHDRGAKDVVAIFATYQTNPQGIMTRSSRNFKSIEDIFKSEGVLLWQSGLPYAQYIQKKFKPFKVRTAPYLGGIGNFQHDPQISQQCFVTSEPLQAEKAGLKVKTFLVADAGYNPYATVLAVRASRLKERPDEVKKMVESVRKGWRGYLKDPRKTNALMSGLNKSIDPATFEKSAQAQAPLIQGLIPASPESIGSMKSERWQTLSDQLHEMKLIKNKVSVQDLFKNF